MRSKNGKLPSLPPLPELPPLPPMPLLPWLRSSLWTDGEKLADDVRAELQRRLSEAQRYFAAGDIEAAVGKIGPVFEHVLRACYQRGDQHLTLEELIDVAEVDQWTKERWHAWRRLRNDIAHEVSPEENRRLAREMLTGVRRLVA